MTYEDREHPCCGCCMLPKHGMRFVTETEEAIDKVKLLEQLDTSRIPTLTYMLNRAREVEVLYPMMVKLEKRLFLYD